MMPLSKKKFGRLTNTADTYVFPPSFQHRSERHFALQIWKYMIYRNNEANSPSYLLVQLHCAFELPIRHFPQGLKHSDDSLTQACNGEWMVELKPGEHTYILEDLNVDSLTTLLSFRPFRRRIFALLTPCHTYLSAGPLALLPLHFQHKFQSVQLPKKINGSLKATHHMKFRLQLSAREVSRPH